jgi:hypothetical protein
MKSKRGGAGVRNKGNSFEREVAKQILDAVGPSFSGEDCRRTPASGGQPFGDRGDLVISGRLFRRFPFVVECKHWRDWHPDIMLAPRQIEEKWLLQVCTATARAKRGGIPLLVMRGDRQTAWCAAPLRDMLTYLERVGAWYFVFPHAGRRWLMVPWQVLLNALEARRKSK